jgi:predicted NodU family carbamoyl transferase
MRVLGIGAEADSGAAIVEDGNILAAINEERLSRC